MWSDGEVPHAAIQCVSRVRLSHWSAGACRDAWGVRNAQRGDDRHRYRGGLVCLQLQTNLAATHLECLSALRAPGLIWGIARVIVSPSSQMTMRGLEMQVGDRSVVVVMTMLRGMAPLAFHDCRAHGTLTSLLSSAEPWESSGCTPGIGLLASWLALSAHIASFQRNASWRDRVHGGRPGSACPPGTVESFMQAIMTCNMLWS